MVCKARNMHIWALGGKAYASWIKTHVFDSNNAVVQMFLRKPYQTFRCFCVSFIKIAGKVYSMSALLKMESIKAEV